eukprot:5274242-Amphidinium_carterae.3
MINGGFGHLDNEDDHPIKAWVSHLIERRKSLASTQDVAPLDGRVLCATAAYANTPDSLLPLPEQCNPSYVNALLEAFKIDYGIIGVDDVPYLAATQVVSANAFSERHDIAKVAFCHDRVTLGITGCA